MTDAHTHARTHTHTHTHTLTTLHFPLSQTSAQSISRKSTAVLEMPSSPEQYNPYLLANEIQLHKGQKKVVHHIKHTINPSEVLGTH